MTAVPSPLLLSRARPSSFHPFRSLPSSKLPLPLPKLHLRPTSLLIFVLSNTTFLTLVRFIVSAGRVDFRLQKVDCGKNGCTDYLLYAGLLPEDLLVLISCIWFAMAACFGATFYEMLSLAKYLHKSQQCRLKFDAKTGVDILA